MSEAAGRAGAPILVGAIGAPGVAAVDGRGLVSPEGRPFELDWWIGGEDGWRCGDDGDRPRQSLVGETPVVETTLRVPGGDAVQRVWGVGGPACVVAVEVENRSAAAFAVAFVVSPVRGQKCRSIDVRDSTVLVEGQPAVVLPRAARGWAVAPVSEGTRPAVTAGATMEGPFRRLRDRRGVEAAFVFPVPHRSSVRVAVLLGTGRAGSAIDLASLPGADAASRGWRVQLERGLRAEVPDERLQRAIDASRALLLLSASAARRPDADCVAMLEDWGFDSEAATAWSRVGTRVRRAAARRASSSSVEPWDRIRTYLAAATPVLAFPGGPAPFLRAVRDLLVRDDGLHLDLLPGFPLEWLGRDLTVRSVPTRCGPVGFALRWHGERPALLWEAPEEIALTASRLDPAWASSGGAGEALLATPPDSLHAAAPGEGEGEVEGEVEGASTSGDAPETFT